MKKSIAIAEATGLAGERIAKALAKNYRLLLFSSDHNSLQELESSINASIAGAETYCPGCPVEAGWEADIIIITGNNSENIIHKIRPVATQKIVIDATSDSWDISTLLPYSKIISLKNMGPAELIENIQSILQIQN